jgi:hypothetical protein
MGLQVALNQSIRCSLAEVETQVARTALSSEAQRGARLEMSIARFGSIQPSSFSERGALWLIH